MTDRNGRPLKVGDIVEFDAMPGRVGTVLATRRTTADVRLPGTRARGKPCHYTTLTLVEPEPEPVVEHVGTNVFEALGRENADELFRRAELVSRVRDIMDGLERSRFPQIADEILKAVRAYHEAGRS